MTYDDNEIALCITAIEAGRGMMDPRVKRDWIAALMLSTQTIGVLQTYEGAKCALGVLLDLYPGRDQLETDWQFILNSATGDHEEVLVVEGSEVELPKEVREWTGLTEKILSEISEMNDMGMPFEAIAYVIEKAL